MGRRQHISKERVVDAAIAILDVDGVAGLSLERIAREIGVRGPSLYYYYPDKSAILDAVAMEVIGDLDIRRPTTDWVDWLVGNAVEFHRRVMAHPNVASLLMEHLAPRATVTGFGHGARLLTAARVDPALQITILEGVQHLAWGFTLHRAVAEARRHHDGALADGERWPELTQARHADRFRGDDLASLEFSVRAFIQGAVDRAEPST